MDEFVIGAHISVCSRGDIDQTPAFVIKRPLKYASLQLTRDFRAGRTQTLTIDFYRIL